MGTASGRPAGDLAVGHGRHIATRNLMALLGLAMIGFSIIAYSVETPFPGATALVPCLGAAFIIAAGQAGDSLVGRMLSLPPVVFVGLISYSLYLWHWPVIFFQRSDAEMLTTTSRLLIVLYSFVLAILSWQFVEKPFRRGFKSAPDRQVVVRGLLGLGAVAVAAYLSSRRMDCRRASRRKRGHTQHTSSRGRPTFVRGAALSLALTRFPTSIATNASGAKTDGRTTC